MTVHLRLSAAVLLLATLAVVLAACGGGNGNSSEFAGGAGDDAAGEAGSTGDDATVGQMFDFGDGSTRDVARPPLPDGCVGGSCFDGAVCGDGVVEMGETCDDGNSAPGDGCSGVCQIEPGYSCPVAGQSCVKIWVCGNGVIDPGETCDDGNTTSNDGCSSTCQVETGWMCSGGTVRGAMGDGGTAVDSGAVDASAPVSKCVEDRCGDGIVETSAGEACDDGNNVSGDGCSSTCQVEPGWSCPTPGASCVAAKCGDGVIAGAETCDDGNAVLGDGCSSTCQVEPGWVCPSPRTKCVAASCGDGIVAGNEQCDLGAGNGPSTGCSSTCTLEPGFACSNAGTPPKTSCHATTCGDGIKEGFEECDDGSPTCTIEPHCTGGKCTAVCGDGLVFPGEACDDGNTISGDGCSSTCQVEMGWTCNNVTQAPASSLSIPILYRDFLYYGTTAPGPGHPDFENLNPGLVTGTVQQMLGADGEPVWASDGNPQAMNGATNFCWWFHESGCGDGGANPYDKLVYLDANNQPTVLTLMQQSGMNLYQFASGFFFPIDGLGWNAGPSPQTSLGHDNLPHNFSFTSELHYPFTYQASATPAPVFTFVGDDAVFAFINGQLVVDLGGVHGPATGTVTLDATTAGNLGLTDGGWYSIDVFQSERHTKGSDYTLTLSDFVHVISQCNTKCGDGIVAGNEVCDDGTNTGSYGGCEPGCMARGPYCGDAKVQSPPEQCDDGSNLATYGGTMKECGPGCKWAPYCGDGTKNGPEACDQGMNNQPTATAYGKSVCTSACTVAPYCGDGIVQAQDGEKCDNGVNDGSYGTCNPDCTLAPYCGDGIKNGSEACDNGSNNVPIATGYGVGLCTSACTAAPYCGDGIVEPQFGEACDGTPGCGSNCQTGGAN